jgi:hypothetical protein
MVIRDDRHNRRNFAAEKFMRYSQVSIAAQAKALQTMFPESRVKIGKNALEWEGTLQPSPHSKVYTIHIKYVYSMAPVVKVLSPILTCRQEEPDKPIPHMYEQQYLCLYYPKSGEWRRIEWLHKSIVPWATSWLYYYELWHVTGQWLGGGIEHGLLSIEDMKDKQPGSRG